jgi:hypothetical protein
LQCLSGVPVASMAYLKLKTSERFRKAKDTWHASAAHHGTEEIPPPPPKKSCLDHMRNSMARTAAQIRTGHWRSAVYLKSIHKRADDKCWFCQGPARMTRSHVLLHYPAEKLRATSSNRGVGRGRTRGCPCFVSHSRVGEAVCQIIRGWENDGRRNR